MQRHPYFDLWLHDDEELAERIGSQITERATLHEWPLSCVQRITCATGASHIYKVQAPPTVEPTFYQNAHSPILVRAQALSETALLLENIQGPHLNDLPLGNADKLALVDDILRQIAQIEGDLPAMADLRSVSSWLAYAQIITDDLKTLVDNGTFLTVNLAMIDQVTAQATLPAVLDVFKGQLGYVHTDLWGENVLSLDDGYRVIDWQRPIWGPVALDRVSLLQSIGIDPLTQVEAGVIELRTLLLIGWLSQAARYWFTAGAAGYDTEIAQIIEDLEGHG